MVRKDGLDADVRAADELAHGPDDARVIDEHSRRPARHRALGEGQRGRVALDPGDLVADRGDLGSCGMGRAGASGAQCQSGGSKRSDKVRASSEYSAGIYCITCYAVDGWAHLGKRQRGHQQVDLRCAEDGRADEVAGEVEAEPLLLRQRHLRTPGDADRALGGRRRTDVVGCLPSFRRRVRSAPPCWEKIPADKRFSVLLF